MIKRLALIAAAAGVALSLATGVGASNPTHLTGEFVFPTTWCGFSGTDDVQFIDNFRTNPDGSAYDAGQVSETFTADNGRGVKVTFDAGLAEFAPPVSNPDGTTTFIATYSGLNAKTQAVHGPVLQQNAGQLQTTAIIDANGNLISFTAVSVAGQNPNLTGMPDCSVVGPYLAGTS